MVADKSTTHEDKQYNTHAIHSNNLVIIRDTFSSYFVLLIALQAGDYKKQPLHACICFSHLKILVWIITPKLYDGFHLYLVCGYTLYLLLISILASALLMMLHRFGMICLIMYFWPLLSTLSERSSKPISWHKHNHPMILIYAFSDFLCVALTPVMSQVNEYRFLHFLFGAPRVCL